MILAIALLIFVILTVALTLYAFTLRNKIHRLSDTQKTETTEKPDQNPNNSSRQILFEDLGNYFEVKQFEPQLIKWHVHEPASFANDLLREASYRFKLSPPNPHNTRVSYFTIETNMILSYEDNEIVFMSTIEIVYQISNDQIKPSPEYLFEIVKHSVFQSNQIIRERAHADIVMHTQFPQPLFSELYADLLQQVLLVYI